MGIHARHARRLFGRVERQPRAENAARATGIVAGDDRGAELLQFLADGVRRGGAIEGHVHHREVCPGVRLERGGHLRETCFEAAAAVGHPAVRGVATDATRRACAGWSRV